MGAEIFSKTLLLPKNMPYFILKTLPFYKNLPLKITGLSIYINNIF